MPNMKGQSRFSLDSRPSQAEHQTRTQKKPAHIPQLTHDIDLLIPFTRNKSSKRQESADSSRALPATSRDNDKQQIEDDLDFERALSSCGSLKGILNDENSNIISNMKPEGKEASNEESKKQRKVVARIQKNKVKFLSAAGASIAKVSQNQSSQQDAHGY